MTAKTRSSKRGSPLKHVHSFGPHGRGMCSCGKIPGEPEDRVRAPAPKRLYVVIGNDRNGQYGPVGYAAPTLYQAQDAIQHNYDQEHYRIEIYELVDSHHGR